ncbi:Lsg locus protein 4 [Haemophilus paracuniculus]|uniref:Lsg locus protein 4 n=1 Tax=Haemophilus paracuniculus TaxID=734 RepID=A0A1T0AQH4_9PAST|nr:glycosyltransferase family 25 protein [Haemophilus paracuniculus]OOR98189.1 Lsg locus protein 4 [Haemophilus paracuniculus]
MKKYLVSLEKDHHRRELFFSQADTADFELFNAINTMNEDLTSLAQKFDVEKFYQRYQRHITKGEAGCTFSHLAIYRLILANNQIKEEEYSLICEDDALFNQDFQENLAQLVQQKNGADFILVGQSKINDFNDSNLEIEYPTTLFSLMNKFGKGQYRYGLPYLPYYAGTVAYLIKKSAIRKLLAQLDNQLPFWLADDFILFEKQFGLTMQVVRPLMAIENPVLTSNLETQRGSIQQSLFKKLLKYPAKKALAIKRNL